MKSGPKEAGFFLFNSVTYICKKKMGYSEYLNNTVWATIKPSLIHIGGIGVFAIRDIKKGTKITTNRIYDKTNFEPFVFDEKEFDLILPEIKELILGH